MQIRYTKLGVTIIIIAVSTAVELLSTNGLSVTFASLLGTILAAYNASNVFATKAHASSPQEGLESVKRSVEDLTGAMNGLVTLASQDSSAQDLKEVKQATSSLLEAQSNVAKLLKASIGLKSVQ